MVKQLVEELERVGGHFDRLVISNAKNVSDVAWNAMRKTATTFAN